jgi:hypothetical protein
LAEIRRSRKKTSRKTTALETRMADFRQPAFPAPKAAKLVERSVRRGGQLLKEMAERGERRARGEHFKPSSKEGLKPALKDLGISEKQSHIWQKLAFRAVAHRNKRKR